ALDRQPERLQSYSDRYDAVPRHQGKHYDHRTGNDHESLEERLEGLGNANARIRAQVRRFDDPSPQSVVQVRLFLHQEPDLSGRHRGDRKESGPRYQPLKAALSGSQPKTMSIYLLSLVIRAS